VTFREDNETQSSKNVIMTLVFDSTTAVWFPPAERADIRLHAHSVEPVRASVSMPRLALSFHLVNGASVKQHRDSVYSRPSGLTGFHLCFWQCSTAKGLHRG